MGLQRSARVDRQEAQGLSRRPLLRQAARQAVDRRHHPSRAEPARRQPRQGAQAGANAVLGPDAADRDHSGDGSRTDPDGPRGKAPRRDGQYEIRLTDHLPGLSQHPCSQTLHTGCTSSASYMHASPVLFEWGSRQGCHDPRENGGQDETVLDDAARCCTRRFPEVRGKRAGIRPLAGNQANSSGTPRARRRSDAIPAQTQAHERQDPAGRGAAPADVQPRR
jgi:hypothetical protein